MHGHPAANGHEADDVVAGDRSTAAGDPHQEIVHALDDDRPRRARGAAPRCRWLEEILFGFVPVGAEDTAQPVDDRL